MGIVHEELPEGATLSSARRLGGGLCIVTGLEPVVVRSNRAHFRVTAGISVTHHARAGQAGYNPGIVPPKVVHAS